jgi:Fic family protein
MMVHLYRSFAEPLTHEMLFKWHEMLLGVQGNLHDVGRYRTHKESMQVVSGSLDNPRVHFEAPPSNRVPIEMTTFLDWFNKTAPGGTSPLPALTRAGIAHLYFVSIHPFEDGNGRIGRTIAEKALAQNLRSPTLTALAATILLKRKAYYSALENGNASNEISRWLGWFAATTIEAQRRTLSWIEFAIGKARLLDQLRGRLNMRQEKALLRLFEEGPQVFKGGLSASNYSAITKATPATTTRDLFDLVAKGALTRSGERKHARYQLGIQVRRVPSVILDKNGTVIEE